MIGTEWQPGDPLYPPEPDQQRCFDCGTRWSNFGATQCPHCESYNVSGCTCPRVCVGLTVTEQRNLSPSCSLHQQEFDRRWRQFWYPEERGT